MDSFLVNGVAPVAVSIILLAVFIVTYHPKKAPYLLFAPRFVVLQLKRYEHEIRLNPVKRRVIFCITLVALLAWTIPALITSADVTLHYAHFLPMQYSVLTPGGP